MSFKVPEEYRYTKPGRLGTAKNSGNFGLFFLTYKGKALRCIAGEGLGWEHVSVSTPNRPPTWAEMCYVKSKFWDDEDTVMQLHPPKSEWVDDMKYCLHLWRPIGTEIPRPLGCMV